MNNIFHLINKATKDKNLKHSEVRILLCLVSYNSFRTVFPSLKTISEDTSIKSKTDISKQLNKLKQRGYIEIIRRKQTSNIYKLVLNKPETKMNYTINEAVKSVTLAKLKEHSINESYLNTILKINTGAGEVYQKCFMLLYCIGSLEKRKDEINNYQSYLLTTYKNLTYSQYHKEVFESKITIRKKIKPDINIITNPEINY